MILNGIDAVVTRQDLLGRSIVLRLPKIDKAERLDETTFWSDFDGDKPKILGALFTAVSVALASWETTRVEGLRMADFARWAAAAVPTFGWPAESFIAAYEDNLSSSLKASLEGSLLATVVIRALDQTHRHEYAARGAVSGAPAPPVRGSEVRQRSGVRLTLCVGPVDIPSPPAAKPDLCSAPIRERRRCWHGDRPGRDEFGRLGGSNQM